MSVLPVVGVRKVWMSMRHRLVPVHMVMFGPNCLPIVMLMLMVLVMNVLMVMPHCFVGVFVFMMFCQVQPGA